MRGRRIVVWGMAAIAVLALASCRFQPATGTFRAQALALDYTASVDVLTLTRQGKHVEFPDDARIVGPHSYIVLKSAVVTDELDKAAAAAIKQNDAVRAADGYELVYLSGESRSSDSAWGSSRIAQTRAVKLGVTVDGKARGFTLPAPAAGPWSILASVPKGKPAYLVVTDEGASQSIDMRSGKRTADARETFYLRNRFVDTKTVSRAANVSLPSNYQPIYNGRYEIRVTGGKDDAFLTDFTPSQGWAKPGRAWVLLSGIKIEQGPTQGYYNFILSTKSAYQLVLPDQSVVRPVRDSRLTTWPPSASVTGTSVIFDVASSFRTGTLKIDINGQWQSIGNSIPVTASWVAATQPAEVQLSFG